MAETSRSRRRVVTRSSKSRPQETSWRERRGSLQCSPEEGPDCHLHMRRLRHLRMPTSLVHARDSTTSLVHSHTPFGWGGWGVWDDIGPWTCKHTSLRVVGWGGWGGWDDNVFSTTTFCFAPHDLYSGLL